MNSKEGFIIYKSFYKPISRLSDKQLGRLFRIIFLYQLGEVVTVEEDIEMAFEFFKNQFDIDNSKYQSKVERNRDNGRKGGAPVGNKNAKREKEKTTENNRSLEKQPKQADKEKDKDKENDLKEKIQKKKNDQKDQFDAFRKKYPGTKRGLETEWENFIKKNPDYDGIIPLLSPALEKLIAWRERKKLAGQFVPEWANFQTWINQRRWESELEDIAQIPVNTNQHAVKSTVKFRKPDEW